MGISYGIMQESLGSMEGAPGLLVGARLGGRDQSSDPFLAWDLELTWTPLGSSDTKGKHGLTEWTMSECNDLSSPTAGRWDMHPLPELQSPPVAALPCFHLKHYLLREAVSDPPSP